MASDRIWGDKSKRSIILDTSAILSLFEFSIDFNSELLRLVGKYEIFVPSQVVEELELLSKKGKGKKSVNSKSALKLIDKYETVDTNEKNADKSVLSLAEKLNGIIFTNDKELRKKANKKNIRTIFLRQKKYLNIDQQIM